MTRRVPDRDYIAARLRRSGHDALADRVERGELSARAAAIEAGILKDAGAPLARLRSAWRRATEDERWDFLNSVCDDPLVEGWLYVMTGGGEEGAEGPAGGGAGLPPTGPLFCPLYLVTGDDGGEAWAPAGGAVKEAPGGRADFRPTYPLFCPRSSTGKSWMVAPRADGTVAIILLAGEEMLARYLRENRIEGREAARIDSPAELGRFLAGFSPVVTAVVVDPQFGITPFTPLADVQDHIRRATAPG